MLELKIRKIGNSPGVVPPRGSRQPAARRRGRSPLSDRGAEWGLSTNTRLRQLQAYGEGSRLFGRNSPRPSLYRREQTNGFCCGILLLKINGYRFTAAEEDATQAIVSLAAGIIDEPSFTCWLRANVSRPPRFVTKHQIETHQRRNMSLCWSVGRKFLANFVVKSLRAFPV
jgi:hypothetical protein